jgi:hypothetical protein
MQQSVQQSQVILPFPCYLLQVNIRVPRRPVLGQHQLQKLLASYGNLAPLTHVVAPIYAFKHVSLTNVQLVCSKAAALARGIIWMPDKKVQGKDRPVFSATASTIEGFQVCVYGQPAPKANITRLSAACVLMSCSPGPVVFPQLLQVIRQRCKAMLMCWLQNALLLESPGFIPLQAYLTDCKLTQASREPDVAVQRVILSSRAVEHQRCLSGQFQHFSSCMQSGCLMSPRSCAVARQKHCNICSRVLRSELGQQSCPDAVHTPFALTLSHLWHPCIQPVLQLLQPAASVNDHDWYLVGWCALGRLVKKPIDQHPWWQ